MGRRLDGALRGAGLRGAALVSGAVLAAAGMAAGPAHGQAALTVRVDGIKPGGVIPQRFAYCVPAPRGHVVNGPDRSPAISWSRGPAGTASYAIIVVDTDVPTVFDNANKEGHTLPPSLARRDFYHWVLVDIPVRITSLAEGADTGERSPKKPGPTRYGVRGISDYSGGGKIFGGYDGPCPPWNDEIAHHYHFRVYALDAGHLDVSGNFTGPDAVRAMQGHILAQGEVVGVYALNPEVAKTLK